MKWFQGTYTQRFNAMFKRRGHLYQGRYKAIPIATDPMDGGLEYFREVSTYIHLNPFRAGLYGEGLKKPLHAYRWSSYPAYCGLVEKVPHWLHRKKVLGTWGLKNANLPQLQKYQQKIEEVMGAREELGIEIRSVHPNKQAVAWLLKSYTTVSGAWIAQRLQMGHRTNCSRAISRFRKSREKEIKELKKRMLKCTG